VDGPSQCLVPAGRPGPFRGGIRWNAAVDRFTGASERHSTACLEFRPGAGLWTVASFRDEAARRRWLDPVKAAFRLLADTGFGGERSRGWGRSDAPEFIEGTLPEMILPAKAADVAAQVLSPPPVEPPADKPAIAEPPADPVAADAASAPPDAIPAEQWVAEPSPVLALSAGNPPPALLEAPPEPPAPAAPLTEPSAPAAAPAPDDSRRPHWLLSLFTPAPADSVDWGKGDYTVLVRGGRVESSAGSGELKKQLQMVAEGSVIQAGSLLHGAATDVGPDGFAHPVFRAGFAVSIPLPEVS
jgi:hypothetical protein